MAISAVHYREMVAVRELLPQGGDVLQIGEANWYGDLDPQVILELADSHELKQRIEHAIALQNLFAIAKAFYAALFAPKRIDSVDAHGTQAALRWDLNRPLKLERKYDLIVNHGTAEHVFHVAQVFGTMHAWTCDGGLMIHEAPFLGGRITVSTRCSRRCSMTWPLRTATNCCGCRSATTTHG